MSEHENGNFVLKFGQNQQKHQPFMAISDFALLYRIRRCGARFRLLSLLIPPVLFLENMVSIRKIGMGMQELSWISFPALTRSIQKGLRFFEKLGILNRNPWALPERSIAYVVCRFDE